MSTDRPAGEAPRTEARHPFTCAYCVGGRLPRPEWPRYSEFVEHMRDIHEGLPWEAAVPSEPPRPDPCCRSHPDGDPNPVAAPPGLSEDAGIGTALPLDVERLGTALHNTGLTICDDGGPGTSLNDVAAEYARLSQPPTGDCPDPEHPDGAYCSNTTGLPTCYVPQPPTGDEG